jgi:hypothetical protein
MAGKEISVKKYVVKLSGARAAEVLIHQGKCLGAARANDKDGKLLGFYPDDWQQRKAGAVGYV